MRPQVITLTQAPRRRIGAVLAVVLVLLLIGAARAVTSTPGTAAPVPAHFRLNLDGNPYACTLKGGTLNCTYIQH